MPEHSLLVDPEDARDGARRADDHAVVVKGETEFIARIGEVVLGRRAQDAPVRVVMREIAVLDPKRRSLQDR